MSAGDAVSAVLAALHEDAGVAVIGVGALGRELEARLGDRVVPDDAGASPEAVVETSGEQGSIEAALERVADLGVVVLAGPDHGPIPLDLYPDLHLRGLTLIGIAAAIEESGDRG